MKRPTQGNSLYNFPCGKVVGFSCLKIPLIIRKEPISKGKFGLSHLRADGSLVV
jgi:hypothetical protein